MEMSFSILVNKMIEVYRWDITRMSCRKGGFHKKQNLCGSLFGIEIITEWNIIYNQRLR